jgi:hypothetical protein
MRPFKKKTRLQRFIGSVNDGVDMPNGIKSAVPSGKLTKAGLIAAGGLAGLTAASAGISSLRRHSDG